VAKSIVILFELIGNHGGITRTYMYVGGTDDGGCICSSLRGLNMDGIALMPLS